MIKLSCLAFLLVVLAGSNHGHVSQLGSLQSTGQSPTIIEKNQRYERELRGGHSDLYRVKLAAGQYLQLVIEQHGVDVLLSLTSPSGQLITRSDSPIGTTGSEVISVIADSAGFYQVEVKTFSDEAPVGRYVIRIADLREASSRDAKNILAERLFGEATLLANEKTDQSVQQAIEKYKEAGSLWNATTNQQSEAWALYQVGDLYYGLGQKRKALEYVERARTLWQAKQDCWGEAKALNEIGSIYMYLAERGKARESFNSALYISKNLGDGVVEAESLHNLGWFHDEGDNPEDSLKYYQRALAVAQKAEDRYEEANATNNIGKVLKQLGRVQDALNAYETSLKLRRALAMKRGVAETLSNIGVLYHEIGRTREERCKALPYYEESLSIRRKISDREGLAVTLNNAAYLYADLGDQSKAIEAHQEALSISKNVDLPTYFARSLSTREATDEKVKDLTEEDRIFLKKFIAIIEQHQDEQKEAAIILENKSTAMHAAGVLREIGTAHGNSGQLDSARMELDICLRIYHALQEKTLEAHTLGGMAANFLNRETVKSFTIATGLFLKAADLYKNVSEKELERSAKENAGMSIYLMGLHLYGTNDSDNAVAVLESAHKMFSELGATSRLADTAKVLGFILQAKQKLREALVYLKEARELFHNLSDKQEEALVINNIGRALLELGDHYQAINILREGLAVGERVADSYQRKEVVEGLLTNLGEAYNLTSDFENAMSYYQQALKFVREGCERPKEKEAALLNNIGSIFDQIGDVDSSIDYLEQARKLYVDDPDVMQFDRDSELGAILSGLGVAYAKKKDPVRAIGLLEESLKLRKGKFPPGETATTLNLGMLYRDQGKDVQAIAFTRDAIKLSKDNGFRLLEGVSLNNLAGLLIEEKKYDEALTTLNSALTISDDTQNDDLKSDVLYHLGDLNEEQGKLIDAVNYYQKSVTASEQVRRRAGVGTFKETYFERTVGTYGKIAGLLLALDRPIEAFSYAERSKARSLLDLLNEAQAALKKGTDPKLIEEEDGLHAKLELILSALESGHSAEELVTLKQGKREIENQLIVTEQQIRKNNPRYGALKNPKLADVKSIQQIVLKPDEVLVEYLQKDNELYVFIIGKDGFATQTIKVSQAIIAQQVAALLKPLRSGDPQNVNQSLSYSLYQGVFQPLEEKITRVNGNRAAQSLIIVPDGVLFYLPFEVLPRTATGTNNGTPDDASNLMLSKYSLRYAPSASMLMTEVPHPSSSFTKDLLAFAPFIDERTNQKPPAERVSDNPLANRVAGGRDAVANTLPYSRGEIESISALFGKSDTKYGTDALKTYFKSNSQGVHYLHLATHGYLDATHPMYSGVLFSDGMLRTHEIFNLSLDADLVVLSACETGLGDLKRGEGVIGLSRAFFSAGTPSLVVSLWNVADPSTAALMKRFYRNLTAGSMTKAQALREAKLWMIKNSYHTDQLGNVTRHYPPYYWAPFILIGKN